MEIDDDDDWGIEEKRKALQEAKMGLKFRGADVSVTTIDHGKDCA